MGELYKLLPIVDGLVMAGVGVCVCVGGIFCEAYLHSEGTLAGVAGHIHQS